LNVRADLSSLFLRMVVVSTFVPTQVSNWRTLYRAAILEPDAAKVSGRIAEAEKEIVQRARELFQENRNNKTDKRLVSGTFNLGSCVHFISVRTQG
jgi:hypothetical protein